MDFKFLLTLGINIAGLWLMWRSNKLQVRYMNPQAVANAFSELPAYKAFWKRYWPMLVMAILMATSWIPYFVFPPRIVIGPEFFQAYGQVPQPLRVFALIDQTSLAPFVKTKRIMAMTRITDNTIDPNYDIHTEHGHIRDIVPGLNRLEIPVSPWFINKEDSMSLGTVEVYVMLLPEDVDETQITTIHDAAKLGGELLGGRSFGFSNNVATSPPIQQNQSPPAGKTQ